MSLHAHVSHLVYSPHILGIEGGLVFSDDVLSRVTLSNELEGHSVHLVQTRLVCSQLLCRNNQTSANLYTDYAYSTYARTYTWGLYMHT